MPKTLAVMLTEVRDRVDEATASFWTDAQLRKWINEAVRDIARRSETLLTTGDITVTGGTQTYAAPTNILRISRAEWKQTGQTVVYPLEYKDFNGMDSVWWTSQQITQGTPQFFTLWGFPPSLTLYLYPIPSAGGVVKVFYYKQATELATDGTADGSNIDVVDGWFDLVVNYAEYTALRKDGDPRWQEAKALYEQHLTEMMELTRRWADAAGAFEFQNTLLPQWLWAQDTW